jgi:hypothetical protein
LRQSRLLDQALHELFFGKDLVQIGKCNVVKRNEGPYGISKAAINRNPY